MVFQLCAINHVVTTGSWKQKQAGALARHGPFSWGDVTISRCDLRRNYRAVMSFEVRIKPFLDCYPLGALLKKQPEQQRDQHAFIEYESQYLLWHH
jgi:hypothetical protein